MFSYSGLTAAQMQRLRSNGSASTADSGRICAAALNEEKPNIAVVAAMAEVIRADQSPLVSGA